MHRGHRDEDERDAVDAERVAHPELRDPGVLLHELELRVGPGLELQRGGDGEQQRDHREAEREVLGLVGDAGGQQRHDQRADERDQADRGQPGKARHHCTTQTAPRITTTPRSIVRAYERTKPFWTRRSRPDEPPTRAAEPADGAVDPLAVEEDQRPGQVDAGAHEDALVDVVLVEVAAGGAGDQRAARARRPARPSRQYRSQASAAPASTSSRVSDQQDRHGQHRVLARRLRADDRLEPGRDGAGRAEDAGRGRPSRRRAPSSAPSSPAATRAGATSSVQRFLPWKVMKNRRDM